MDEEPIFVPNDVVAERMTAYCGLIAQIESIGAKERELKAEAMKFLEAVRATITPRSEPATLLALKGGAAKPL